MEIFSLVVICALVVLMVYADLRHTLKTTDKGTRKNNLSKFDKRIEEYHDEQ